jgi:hypothetical protein
MEKPRFVGEEMLMSDNQTAEPDASQTMKPRRIDGPHTVGPLQVEHRPALVLELAGVAANSASPYQSESLDFSGEQITSLSDLLELDESLDAREEQLETQAGQLATHLQEQLRELEYREALQNARAAELDNDFRRARLWITETSAELTERESTIAAAEAKLAIEPQEAERLPLAGADAVALVERERQIVAKENYLRERRQLIEREAGDLHHARVEWECSREEERAELSKERAAIREELETELSGRAAALSKGEVLLAEHARELEKDRQALTQERADWQRQKAADQETIALQRQQAETELEQRRTRLATRETALDQQQGAIEQLRCEITAAHRQSIEMRLMAEQLWAQVQGRMPPAEITQSIAQLRLKLAEQYRLEQQGLAEQKQELLRLAEKVAEQSGTLRTQRQELQTWFAAREEEIEHHAKLLVTREQELLEQSDQLRAVESRWNSDRRQLEQELREMNSRMRKAA